jgi:hypothetical protein
MTLPSTITDGDIPTQGRVKALVASNARATASSYAAIPAALDQLRVNSTGNSVLGQLISDVALGRTYRVDSEPSYGTAGTTANYTLTGISQPGDPTIAASLIPQMSQALVDNAQATALAAAVAGIVGRANLAAITGADGYYRAMDTGYVYQRSSGVNTRRVDLEASFVRSGTRAQRQALAAPLVVTRYYETDTHLALTYTPGTGWRRDGDGGDPDYVAPATPPDTGGY